VRCILAIGNALLLMGFNSQTLELINQRAEETCAALERIETQVIPKSVDWSPDQKPIRFIDALDRKVNLPYEYCTTWKVPMIFIFSFFFNLFTLFMSAKSTDRVFALYFDRHFIARLNSICSTAGYLKC
jgi:hypothetical protein